MSRIIVIIIIIIIIIFIVEVRCVVRAHPPANVDWVKQGETIETGGNCANDEIDGGDM